MTNKEAIQFLEHIAESEGYTDLFRDACRTAIGAMEKQEPETPDFIYGDLVCSTCHSLVYDDAAYCKHCGQRLDWRYYE